ncbi:hypothetical protein ACKFKF_25305 [Phormidesmis sp. 146-12]
MQFYKAKAWGFQIIGLLLLNTFTANSINAQPTQTGLKFRDSPALNVGVLYSLRVTATYQVDSGQCHGPVYLSKPQTYTRNYTDEPASRAVFISKTMPAPGLRVVIRNITPGIDQNPSPYTDREYDKAPTSEGFKVNVGVAHSGRYLAVREGKNDFSYEIKRANSVIESGSFTATIQRQTKAITRDETMASSSRDKDAECRRTYDEENKRDRKRH